MNLEGGDNAARSTVSERYGRYVYTLPRARSLVDFEIFSKPTGNHHLSFYGE